MLLFFIHFRYTYEFPSSKYGMISEEMKQDLSLMMDALDFISRICQQQGQYSTKKIRELCLTNLQSNNSDVPDQRTKRVGWTISV